jgi:hypothetical protein
MSYHLGTMPGCIGGSMMYSFHIKYKSGSTFVDKIRIINEYQLRRILANYRSDDRVERVLVDMEDTHE